jgi:transcriptional regulator with XRE-family HTH domain
MRRIVITVGENIRRIRQERGLTQRQLGEMVGQVKPIFVPVIENEEVAEALKDLFPDFSYVKRKRKPKKE